MAEAEEGLGSEMEAVERSSSGGSSVAELEDGSGVSSTSSLPVFAATNASPHPLASAKHICAICGDRASGKHYGVFR